ncbi:MAG TPA: SDR family oxidoreductase [Rhodothermales bacterium]|nr:SDR family oxidoreductase [Rhodothermales bacterium]
MRFVTGFPGFLGAVLVERLLQRSNEPVVCLVEPRFAGTARAAAARLEAIAARPGVLRIVEGDVTRPDLGLGVPSWQRDVTAVYHLAAAYDLAVEAAPAERVNVDGTRHVLRFWEGMPGLARLHYVSTCYVCGTHTGVFREADLDVGQGFFNHYERTKFLAEVEVRRAMADGLPATIYRPSVVVGDARTGETQKYDGPYGVIRWLLRWPHTAPLPVPGDPYASYVNLVPRDFVTAAFDALAHDATTLGKTIALADHTPLTVDATIRVLESATGRRVQRVPVPMALAAGTLHRVPALEAWLGITAASLPYFAHRARFDTREADAHLRPHGVSCPRFEAYAARLVAFIRAHPKPAGAPLSGG